MALKRGLPESKRNVARNFTHAEAQRRLDETVAGAQRQQLNALQVDSHEVEYFYRVNNTHVCTCKETEMIPERVAQLAESDITPELDVPELGNQSITFDWNRPLFGGKGETLDSDLMELDELEDTDDGREHYTENETVDALMSSSVDCGICYRNGFAPSYGVYGHQHEVFTTHRIEDVSGYTIDATCTPHRLVKFAPRESYVEFLVDVPLYFQQVSFSVRDNTRHLKDEVIYAADGKPLTSQDFRNNAGHTMVIHVLADAFTHLVVDFKTGDNLNVNSAQISKTQDWTLFETIGGLSIVAPVTVQEPKANDIIYLRKLRITLKVTDVQYMKTSKGSQLDWNLSTRVVQPQETFKHISTRMILL